MLYKTILLQVIQERPVLQSRLMAQKALLATVERFARELKSNHEAWTDRLTRARPGSAADQIQSEAMELALVDVMDTLLSEFSTVEDDALSLEDAMAFLRRHTPPE